MAVTPAVFGMTGLSLTADEKAFFRDSDPAGYIIFGRNIESKAQLRALTDELRAVQGRDDLAILIDQEGGRVARMQEPLWPKFPAGEVFDKLYDIAPATAIEAARINAQAIAVTLHEVGITVDCHPLLDVRQPDANNVIGDRALGSEPMRVAALGRAILDGLQRGGVVGVVKHLPGHGRTSVDTHKALPTVTASDEELQLDLAPFQTLNKAPMGMTGHLLFTAWDAETPSTLSKTVIQDIIRDRIGFDGLLFTDDLDMEALSGTVPERAERAQIAGCDIALNCWGKMDDMTGIAERLAPMSDKTQQRLDQAMATITDTKDGDSADELAMLLAKRDELIAATA
ncbi:beta-N-acetylhexosaminidase [uncultured Parasphingorhabdus sp.]|uniref:beta-N-acetylhexosaminidase n=1 Tax=uncultured Parasphingorhabdus sp. TaxID=2709694 RepID=UPI0030DCE14C|tara:strand:+ start:46599 stop:47624 length:1026 start_codon:yes stop_codon:yes gene_type:complete